MRGGESRKTRRHAALRRAHVGKEGERETSPDGADFGRGIVTLTLAVEALSFFDLPTFLLLFFRLVNPVETLRGFDEAFTEVFFLALAVTLPACLLLFIRVEVFMLALMFSRPLPLVLALAFCRALTFFRLVEGSDFSACSPSRSPNHPHLANIFRMYSCVETIPFFGIRVIIQPAVLGSRPPS